MVLGTPSFYMTAGCGEQSPMYIVITECPGQCNLMAQKNQADLRKQVLTIMTEEFIRTTILRMMEEDDELLDGIKDKFLDLVADENLVKEDELEEKVSDILEQARISL